MQRGRAKERISPKEIMFDSPAAKDMRWIYVIMTEWPGREISLTSLRPKEGSKIAMLGSEAAMQWSADPARGTVIRLPENLQSASNRPCEHAWSLKVQAG